VKRVALFAAALAIDVVDIDGVAMMMLLRCVETEKCLLTEGREMVSDGN
jgi:hypothetical protein